MADYDNLRTASLYINNQLLSRGLLRDGQNINFVDPSDDDGGTAATMGRIIAVVNDLILRRDRDAEHRESLSTTLRTVRAESLRQTNDMSRLAERHSDAKRKLAISEATEAALRTQLKSSEGTVRGLKDDVARAKSFVAQTRTSCATELRRRDRQIDGLKKQLGEAGRSRGAGRNPAVTVITVTGDIGQEKASPLQAGSTDSTDYDLRSETNEFLTELAKGLSEENASLLSLLRRTRSRLKEMSGWEKGRDRTAEGHAVSVVAGSEELASDLEAILDHLRVILTNPSFVPIEEVVLREEEIDKLRDGWVKMETRWKEAVHLIDGWRKRMVTNGRPVNIEELKMGLRLSPVRVREVEETSQGLDLRLFPVQEECEDEIPPLPTPSPAESLHLVPAPPEYEEPESESESSVFEADDLDIEELDIDEPNVQILQQSMAGVESLPLPPPQLSPLRDSNSAGNRGISNLTRPRRKLGDFTTIVEEKTCDLMSDGRPAVSSIKARREPSPIRQVKPETYQTSEVSQPPSITLASSSSSLDSLLLAKPAEETTNIRMASKPRRPPTTKTTGSSSSLAAASQSSQSENEPPQPAEATEATAQRSGNRSPKRISSRLPLPRNANAPPPQSPLTMATIAAKLAASEREADAARVRAKLKAARMGKAPQLPSLAPPATVDTEIPIPLHMDDGVDPVKRDKTPVAEQEATADETNEKQEVPKRKRERRTSKAASRRRSTLSPWELESLISGNVPVAPT